MQINVLEYLARTAAQFPDRTAITDRDSRLTFGELWSQGLRLGAVLQRRVGAHHQPVGVYLPKSCAAVECFVAIVGSGNCYVPLDVKAPPARLKSVLDSIRPELVITSPELAGQLLAAGWDAARLVTRTDLSAEADDTAAATGWTQTIDTDPVYIIATSGSTGIPKGVAIPHRGVIDYIDWARSCFTIEPHDVVGNQAPFFFDNSTLDLYLCFATGATLHLIPEELFAFPLRLLEHVARTGITFVFWVPSVLINVANAAVFDKAPCPGLRQILFAGEVMPNKQLNAWRRAFPGTLFANLYGPTEITVDCTYFIVDREFADTDPLPIGIPCRNSDILILNDRDTRCGAGEPGELCVRGSSLALGYWNDAEKSAAAFTQNPLNPHYPERIYRTGDLVQQNERGEILFLGRKDLQIKHLGYRIELGEIETAAVGIERVRNACALYDRERQEIRLVYEAESPLTPAEFRRELLKQLPKYMLPGVFEHCAALPLTSNGKIDRTRLAVRGPDGTLQEKAS